MLLSDPELVSGASPAQAGWGAARVAACGCGATSCLAGLGWVPARQVCVSQKTGRVLCSGVERHWGRGSLGRRASILLTSARRQFPPRSGALWQRDGVGGCPALAQLSF